MGAGIGAQGDGLSIQESLRWWARAERVIPGGSQTNSKRPAHFAFGRYPIFAARAEGSHIWDVDGNEYVDFVNALGPISLGYGHPAVDEAVRRQLARGVLAGLLWPLEVEVAEGLVEAIPGAEMVRFFKGGGEATAAAARIARTYTGRHLILNAGYRGWPDAWSAGRDPAVPPDVSKYLVSFRHDDLDQLAALLETHRGQVAAVFVDVPYAEVLPAAHLQAMGKLVHDHGALFVFDEIVAGFRLARGGAHEYFDVTADLACFAKGMANGLPLAAVVGRREVMAVAERALISITYGGEALSLAACAAVLDVYRRQDVVGHLWATGRQLMDGLNRAAQEAAVPFRCTGYAPMSAMHLDLPADRLAEAWTLLLAECARRGVLLRRGGLNFITLAHTAADVERTVAACAEAFAVLRAAGFDRQAGPSAGAAAGAGARGQQVGPLGQ
ncbi:MAG TPA: aminotransferase class III-fold pyridoxal phosphate-dependent enzyme [Chloroflexota bacterium]|nr:aminotransferase class III-fold pyridoxal phosphate-dependent enzyme [Chloroflexota bacterium]